MNLQITLYGLGLALMIVSFDNPRKSLAKCFYSLAVLLIISTIFLSDILTSENLAILSKGSSNLNVSMQGLTISIISSLGLILCLIIFHITLRKSSN